MTLFRTAHLQTVVGCLIVLTAAHPAVAQRTGGSEAELLRRSEVHRELGLSEEQSQKLEELQAKSNTSRDDFEQFRKDLSAATTDEEKTKIREEFSQKVIKSRSLFQDNARAVLTPEQQAALRGLYLKNAGPRGLTNDEISAEYGLTDEQKEEIQALAQQQRAASRSLPSDATEEDREKFNQDWQEKFLAVLTDDQKARYQKELSQAPGPSEAVAEAEAPAERPAEAGSPADPAASAGSPAEMSNEPPEGAEAVASFGGDVSPGNRRTISEFSFNFRYAPWDQVLQMFADATGLTLDLNKTPPGTFSHLDNNKYSAEQALDILNGYLLRKGFGLFEKDGFLHVRNLDDGIPPSLIRDVSIEELLNDRDKPVGDHELVNVTIEIDDMDTGKAAQEIEALLGPWGSMIALTESNLLILTDIGSNLRRIYGLLQTAMSKSRPDAQLFKMYYLRHMDAEEAEIAVMTQFGMRQNVANVSYGVEQQSRSRSRNAAPQPAPTPSKPETEIQIASDLRLNSLLVTGTAKQHELVETILSAIDVGEDRDGNTIGRSRRGTYLEVYQVKSADAGEVTKTITAMNIPGVQVVNEDRRTGRIHIMATERQHEEVAALVRQLDGGGSSGSVSVIQLHQMDPLSAAATLRSLFYAEGEDGPTIETDLYGRRLIVRGSVEHITQIKQVLADLGETGGPRERAEGKVRNVPLQGRDPEKFLRILKQNWEDREKSRLEIYIPEESGPVKSRQTAEGELPSSSGGANPPPMIPTPQPQRRNSGGDAQSGDSGSAEDEGPKTRPGPPVTSIEELKRSHRHIPVRSMVAQDENQPTRGQPAADSDNSSDDPPVEVYVLGDDLVITGRDEDELDRLEDLLDTLQQTIPFKPEYTQFFLKSADALEASDMLSQFFPSSSVATTSMASGGSMLGSLTSGLGSMGSDLMDATGLSGLGASSNSLKIIPDIRTNSLFMSGPPMMIKDAIALLKVLDSNDGPDSLKDMQARQIPVAHADVRDVKSMLDQLFKTYLEPQGNGRQQQQQNPLAAMFGGGGGRNNEATQIRMTLAVDEQNSLILVNSSQDLFEEVEDVVGALDQAAQDANRLIRVIQLKNADATMIQQSLTNLLPRVSVTSSRTNSSSGGSGSSGGSSGGNDDKARQAAEQAQREAFQRAIQQRFQQQRGGGGGGNPGGSRQGGRGFGGFGGGRGGR